MNAALVGALAAAGVLGVTHAIEPDHVAGIASLTSQYGDARLSAIVGVCFSVGHVVLVVAWLAIGYGLFGRTAFAGWMDEVGTLGVGVVLGILGATMIASGLRAAFVAHSHEHEHDHADYEHEHGQNNDHEGDAGHAHRHVHLVVHGRHDHADREHADYEHEHGHDARAALGTRVIGTYLTTGVVGALFTLSPPLSMIAFAATLFPRYGADAVLLSVLAYAVAITATMSLVGAGAGALFSVTSVDPRVHGLARGFVGVLVAGFAVAMLVGSVPALV
jgi:ABC-type nickel/cobalt efflux system permease component RcnA